MTDSDAPRSPFAGKADLLARRPVRVLSADDIEQMFALHQLYLETDTTKATARIFRRPTSPGEISPGGLCAGLRWTAPCSEGLISAEPICAARI